jgi:hypothetical protein
VQQKSPSTSIDWFKAKSTGKAFDGQKKHIFLRIFHSTNPLTIPSIPSPKSSLLNTKIAGQFMFI